MHDDADNPEHFHPGPDAIVEDIEGVEMFSLTSVGIDIGSSTSHLVFSHLTLRREGAGLSARFRVTDREVLYRSPIMLTPYSSGTLIDTARVEDFIHESYRVAGYTHDDIDTGAVVITGEALNKENSRPILEYFAKDSGKFICASAGPNHEALLAAYGCGAVDLSKSAGATVLNIDMGGGTTKLSVIRDGTVTQTAAISVGARLIAFDEDNVVTRVELPATFITRELGSQVEVGQTVTDDHKRAFASYMADYLFNVIQAKPLSDLEEHLLVTDVLPDYDGLDSIDHIVFSGGVSEHIYDHEVPSYGDVGPFLGKEIRDRIDELNGATWSRNPSRASAPPSSAPASTRSRPAATPATSPASRRCRCTACRWSRRSSTRIATSRAPSARRWPSSTWRSSSPVWPWPWAWKACPTTSTSGAWPKASPRWSTTRSRRRRAIPTSS